MKVMSKKTSLKIEEIIKKAKEKFDENLGLKLVDERDDCCLDFRGDLGFVTVQIFDQDQNREVKLTTREYEYQIQEFLRDL